MQTVRSADGVAIAYDRTGEGPPLVMVGGAFQTRSDPNIVHLAALLSPRFTVFTYDRRGRGASTDAAPYAVAREVDDLAALVAAAGAPVFVFGISSGAVLALEGAARGLPIARLALWEPPLTVGEDEGLPVVDHAAAISRLVSAGRRGDAVEYGLTQVFGLPEDAVAQMRTQPDWSTLEAVVHTLPYDFAIAGDRSLLAGRAASIAVPAVVIDGEHSDEFLRRAASAIASALPNGEHRTLVGQTHAGDPAVIAPVVQEFFAA